MKAKSNITYVHIRMTAARSASFAIMDIALSYLLCEWFRLTRQTRWDSSQKHINNNVCLVKK